MNNSYISIDESISKLLEIAGEHPEYFVTKANKGRLSVEQGVKEFYKKRAEYESSESLPLKVQFNTYDIIYKTIEAKYKDYFMPGRIEELLNDLKQLAEKNNEKEFNKLKQRVKLMIINIEAQIVSAIPDYRPKFFEKSKRKM